MNIDFKDPWILLLIPFVVLFVLWWQSRSHNPHFVFSSTDLAKNLTSSWKVRLSGLPFLMRISVLILWLMALAGPRAVLEEVESPSEGIDIVLTTDISMSMAAEDFVVDGQRVNRLDVVKKVVDEFIGERKTDRLGLVAFAGVAYTVCPLTTDYTWLRANLQRVTLGLIQDGTAIGSAILMSLSRFKNSEAKSKVIILLTDGVSNAGKTDPISAARTAQAMGVKIYTICAGTGGYVPYPVTTPFGRKVYQRALIEIDEATLKEIARLTDGQYFRATDTESLRKIYQAIDALEKTKIEQSGFKEYRQLFPWIVWIGLAIFLSEIILSRTVFLKVP
jgi:Ca-activated chloride channel family protein